MRLNGYKIHLDCHLEIQQRDGKGLGGKLTRKPEKDYEEKFTHPFHESTFNYKKFGIITHCDDT